jgi:hypothetical protein
MRNTADVTGSKSIAVLLQSISGVSAINPLVAFYDIHGMKKRGAILLFCPGHHTRLSINSIHTEINCDHTATGLPPVTSTVYSRRNAISEK